MKNFPPVIHVSIGLLSLTFGCGIEQKIESVATPEPAPVVQPLEISIVSGDDQATTPDTSFVDPLAVRVTRENGDPVEAWEVEFKITSGEGTIITESSPMTDATGTASVLIRAGNKVGELTFSATLISASGAAFSAVPARFRLQVSETPIRMLSIHGGGGQAGTVGSALSQPIEVLVHDWLRTPITGAHVQFSVESGTATFVPGDEISSNLQGIAAVQVTLGTVTQPVVIRATLLPEDPQDTNRVVRFHLKAVAAAPNTIEFVDGIQDSNGDPICRGAGGQHSVRVLARDIYGNVCPDEDLDVTLTHGVLYGTTSSTGTVRTQSDGIALIYASGEIHNAMSYEGSLHVAVASRKSPAAQEAADLQFTRNLWLQATTPMYQTSPIGVVVDQYTFGVRALGSCWSVAPGITISYYDYTCAQRTPCTPSSPQLGSSDKGTALTDANGITLKTLEIRTHGYAGVPVSHRITATGPGSNDIWFYVYPE